MAGYTTFVLVLSLSLLSLSNAKNVTGTNNTDCSCGYYDISTKELFTESIIVYFNETDSVPEDSFHIQSYENPYEKGWNSPFRQGAQPSNVEMGNSSDSPSFPQALNLYVDPSTPEHLVVGGGIRTKRRDVHYGSFRTYLRSPRQYVPGSALSMVLHFNESQSFTMDMMNTGQDHKAWISMLLADEFPDRDLAVNYSTITNSTFSPWDYTEFRIDWTKDKIKWFIGGESYRNKTREEDPWLPSAPAPFEVKHWSTGNFFSMQGPPEERSVANVGWMRLFFNSTMTTADDEKAFALNCKISDACSVDDMKLRGSTPHSTEATVKWKQARSNQRRRTVALCFAVVCICFTVFLLIHSFAKRKPQKKVPVALERKPRRFPFLSSREHLTSGDESASQLSLNATPSGMRSLDVGSLVSPSATPFNRTRAPSIESRSSRRETDDLAIREIVVSISSDSDTLRGDRIPSNYFNAKPVLGRDGKPTLVGLEKFDDEITPVGSEKLNDEITPASQEKPAYAASIEQKDFADEKTGKPFSTTASNWSTYETLKPTHNLPEGKKRVDYLVGLVAVSSLLITCIHFGLTFIPAAINPGSFEHYASEVWARKTIDPYLLNIIWIGPFLMTSARFLVSSYLRDGSLLKMAEKTIGRPFRLMLPVTAIVLLEYFLMDCGATKWLQYLASVTWSTWPFTVGFNNFGNFLSETLQLVYLIPNAAPQITFNFCTGVLWTIPVQLQGSWIALLAVLVIREIKTPWKRFLYYTLCILFSWYALLWASYFYLGIMLTDLDLTFKWRKYLHSRPLAYYPLLLFFAIVGLGGLTTDLVSQWTLDNYSSHEYGVHPDGPTGLPIMQTAASGYPDYFVPKLNGILFSFGFQAVIELSPLVQKVLSIRLLKWVFPHIFTIYLIHGFIFWSLGAALCVFLASHGFAYWLNMLLVALCCYGALFLSLPVLTPVAEGVGKRLTMNIWRFSHEKPAPRRPTLFPFPKDLFLKCSASSTHERKDSLSRDEGGRLSFEGNVVPEVALDVSRLEAQSLEGKVVPESALDVSRLDGQPAGERKSRFSEDG